MPTIFFSKKGKIRSSCKAKNEKRNVKIFFKNESRGKDKKEDKRWHTACPGKEKKENFLYFFKANISLTLHSRVLFPGKNKKK